MGREDTYLRYYSRQPQRSNGRSVRRFRWRFQRRSQVSRFTTGRNSSSTSVLSLVASTAGGVPGSITEMAESWKVEETCVPAPSPVMDASAPCANHEARKEWAEKECHMVRGQCLRYHCMQIFVVRCLTRSLTNPTEIHSLRVSRNSTTPSCEHSTSSVSTMHASMLPRLQRSS